MFKGDVIASAAIFLGSLYLFWETSTFEGHEVYAKLGPAYWPRFLLICLMGLSLLVALDAFKERKKGAPDKGEAAKPEGGKWRLWLAVALIVLYFLLMKVVGFIALTPFFLIAFMYLLGERKTAWMVGVSIGITVLIVYVFTKAMYVPLPRGTGIFLDFSHLFY